MQHVRQIVMTRHVFIPCQLGQLGIVGNGTSSIVGDSFCLCGRWPVAGGVGGSVVAGGPRPVAGGRWPVASVAGGRRPVAGGRRPVAGGRWPVAGGVGGSVVAVAGELRPMADQVLRCRRWHQRYICLRRSLICN